jgi:hypothetical protein
LFSTEAATPSRGGGSEKIETRISNSTEARPEIFSSPIHFPVCAVAAPAFTHNPLPCGGGVGGWVVLGGRRKNKMEGGNVIEEEIERTKKNNRIIIFYLKLFINYLYYCIMKNTIL